MSALTGNDFTSGPIYLASNVILYLEAGVTLHASTDPAAFQRTSDVRTKACDASGTIATCGTLNASNTGCQALINACRLDGAGVQGPGTIEGHGWSPLASGDNQGSIWWKLATDAKNGNYAASVNAPKMIQFSQSTNVTLSGFAIHNAPLVHILLSRVTGAAVSRLTIQTPTPDRNTGVFPYNSDGMDVSGSKNISIDNVDIADGDDNIAFEGGGGGPVSNIVVSNSTFRAGHGLSIGSPTASGVTNFTARNIRFIGTDNGLRIKTYRGAGGIVDHIQYSGVCIANVKNPIVIDPFYSPPSGTTAVPQFRNVEIDNLYADGGAVTLRGYDAANQLSLTLKNVRIDALKTVTASNANVTQTYDTRFPQTIAFPVNATGLTVTKQAGAVPLPVDMKAYCGVAQSLREMGPIVSQDLNGNHATIGEAIAANANANPTIWIEPGNYAEAVTVDTPNTQLRGIGNVALNSLAVNAPDFQAGNLTIQGPVNLASDRAVLRNVRMGSISALNSTGHYIADCALTGSGNLIEGGSRLFFDACRFQAAGTTILAKSGTVIANSVVTGGPSIALGQGNGMAFLNTQLPGSVTGWQQPSSGQVEFNSTGPGSDAARPQLPIDQLPNYLPGAYLNWDPTTVPTLRQPITTDRTATVSSASFAANTPLAADQIVAIFGINFSKPNTTVTLTDPNGAGYKADLFSSSAGQINAHLPAGIPNGPVTLTVANPTGPVATQNLVIASASPGLYSADFSGTGLASGQLFVAHPDGSLTVTLIGPDPLDIGGPTDSAALVLYGTGFRNGSVLVLLNGQPLRPFYAGPVAGYLGLDQINVALPKGLAGSATVSLLANGLSSNQVTALFRN